MHNFENYLKRIPKEKGNYILIFQIRNQATLQIGSLGEYTIQPGQYCYTGSALGPGGIQARVRHHLKPSHKPHWHMDYLKPHIQWIALGWKTTAKRLECDWAQTLSSIAKAVIPIAGFGASDCKRGCAAHLVSLPIPISSLPTLLETDELIEFKYNKTNFDT